MPNLHRPALFLLPLLAVGATGCQEEDNFNALTPRIGITECVADDDEDACELHAGIASLLTPKLMTVTLENRGDALLSVETAQLDSSSDPAFVVVGVPERVAPGETAEVTVRFTPSVEGTVRGVLLVRTDATNVPCIEQTACDPTLEGLQFRDLPLVLKGEGVDGASPSIVVDKEACEFGQIGAGAQTRCTISVENAGESDLVIEDLFVDPASTASPTGSAGGFTVQPAPAAIAPGLRASFDVTFAPDVEGLYGATLQLVSNDPERRVIQIELTGEQVDAPTCQVAIKTINGLPVADANPEVEPLDDVVLSVEGSTASSPTGQIIGVVWEFVEKPAGSTISFSSPTLQTTGFVFDGNVAGVDMAGRYRMRATVYDSLGMPSTNLCEVAFDAVPAESLLVQLGWDSPASDMDLHLLRMDDNEQFCSSIGSTAIGATETENCGSFANENDCHFGNCTTGGLDWDQSGTSNTPGDPSLDIDDLCGYGPENITVPWPAPGRYLLAVHYWGPSCGGGGPVGNTVRVYLQGALELELYRSLNVNEWWEAAIVHWPGPGGVPCVERLDNPGTCG